MAVKLLTHHQQILSDLFGILGNIIACFVYLAPLPTFLKMYRHKSTLEFSAIPYSVALFSAMLTLYYGVNKNDHYLITINTIGIFIQSFYLAFYMLFASTQTRLRLMKMILMFNMGVFGGIILFTLVFTHGHLRVKVVGYFVAVFSICVFASPLSVMRQVIITKNVGSLPAGLSLCLTLCALVWFVYGFLIHDYFVLIPNILGLLLGFAQMGLYLHYKDNNKSTLLPNKTDQSAFDHQDLVIDHLPTTKENKDMVKIIMEVQITPPITTTTNAVPVATTPAHDDDDNDKNNIIEDGIKDVDDDDNNSTTTTTDITRTPK